MSYATSNNYKIIKFDVESHSKTKTFERFKRVFLAYANARGYGDIARGDTPVPKKTDATTNQLKEDYEKNIMGYSDLILSVMNDYEAFELVNNTRNDDYPDGNVFRALTDLEDRYKTSKSAVVEELEEKWEKRRMLKKGGKPVKLLNTLVMLQKQLESKGVKNRTSNYIPSFSAPSETNTRPRKWYFRIFSIPEDP